MSEVTGTRPVATPSQTVGPFFHFGLTSNASLGRVAPEDAAGERIRIRIRVLDGDSLPVTDAMIEVYQADAAGRYAQPGFAGFGRLPTDHTGTCVFETVRPGAVPVPGGRAEAPHLNVCVFARGLLRHLYTRIYLPDPTGIPDDPVLLLVPEGRRSTLSAVRADDSSIPPIWDFVIRLQGEQETAFFDV